MDSQVRILLIDDNSDDRVLIRRALTQEFERVVSEVGDAEALARARVHLSVSSGSLWSTPRGLRILAALSRRRGISRS